MIRICTADPYLSRLLQLQLEDCGYDVSVYSPPLPLYEDAVVDLDSDPAPKLSGRCITVSGSRYDAMLTRPFLLSDLRSLVSKVFGPPDSGARRDPVPSADRPVLLADRVVLSGRPPVKLSDREHGLLKLLMDRAGSVVTVQEIRDLIFPGSTGNEPAVYISLLRRKIDIPGGTRLIRTMRNGGYYIQWQQEPTR